MGIVYPGLASLRPGLYAVAPFGGYYLFDGVLAVTLVDDVFLGGIMVESLSRFEIEKWTNGV